MPKRRGVQGRPVEFLTDPAAPFAEGQLVDGAPLEVVAAQELVRRLTAALADHTLAGVCRDAGLNRSTVQALLAGRSYCDIVTLAKLEAVLGVGLWAGAQLLGERSVSVHAPDRSSDS